MKKIILKINLFLILMLLILVSCQKSITSNDTKILNTVSEADLNTVSISAAELVSGFSFNTENLYQPSAINDGSALSVTSLQDKIEALGKSKSSPHKGSGILSRRFSVDGTSLFVTNDTLLAVFEFLNLGENLKNYRGFILGGATITNYDSLGNIVTIPTDYLFPLPGYGSSLGYKRGIKHTIVDFQILDSIFFSVAKTIINFGAGITQTRGTDVITRAGQIILTRNKVSSTTKTLTVSFNNYSVNNVVFGGTKTIQRVYTNNGTNYNLVYSTAANGTLTLANSTVLNIVSQKTKTANYTNATKGTITSTDTTNVTFVNGGSTYFSQYTATPIVEDLSCASRLKPKTGKVNINYLNNIIVIDYTGDCSTKTITVTINGVITTKQIGFGHH